MSSVCWCGRVECDVREVDEGACNRAALSRATKRIAELERKVLLAQLDDSKRDELAAATLRVAELEAKLEAERDLAVQLVRNEAARTRVVEAESAAKDAALNALREALAPYARGAHTIEEFPDHPVHWPARLDCKWCTGFGEDIDHLDRRHKHDCPTRVARAALSLEAVKLAADAQARRDEAVQAVIDAWDRDEIGQVDGGLIDDLRAALAKVKP